MKEDRKFYRRHWTTGDMKLFEWIAETAVVTAITQKMR